MDIPLLEQAVAKHPVVLAAAICRDEVIAAHRFLPPVILYTFGAVHQLQGAVPVQLPAVLSQGLWLWHQPEGALQAVLAGVVVVACVIAADQYRKFRQVLVPASNFFYGL